MSSDSRKVLFAYDAHMFKNKNNYYNDMIDNKLKERYLFLGDELSFMMRLRKISDERADKSNYFDHEKYTYIEIPDFKSFWGYLKNIMSARRIIFEAVSSHDILVARLPSAIGTIAVKAARKYDVPYLVEYVGCTFDAHWNYDWRGKIIALYKMWQQKRLMKNVPYTIYVTKEYLQNKYPTKGQSIGCSDVELQDIEENTLTERTNKIEQSDGKKLVLGTIAAIDAPYKGQDDVIKAVRKLKKAGVDVLYKVVGGGDPSRLEKIIAQNNVEDSVEILGKLKHEEVFGFLKDIDLYIQPSKQEGLPRALVEAMSKACPALGARTAGIPELVSNECIFTPGSVSEITEKIKSIDEHWLINQARENFEESKSYQKEVLEDRRMAFFEKFIDNELNK